MLDEKAPPAARISAATSLLDRGYGKARQEVEISSKFDYTRLTDDQLDLLADCVFNLAALNPAYPIKRQPSAQRTQASQSVDTPEEPLLLTH